MLQVLQGPPQFFTCLGDYITWQCTVKIGRYTIKSIQLLSSCHYQQKTFRGQKWESQRADGC